MNLLLQFDTIFNCFLVLTLFLVNWELQYTRSLFWELKIPEPEPTKNCSAGPFKASILYFNIKDSVVEATEAVAEDPGGVQRHYPYLLNIK